VAIFGRPFLSFLHAHINSSINVGTPSQLVGSGLYCSTGNRFALVRLDVSVYPAQTGFPPRMTVDLSTYVHTHNTHALTDSHTHTHKRAHREIFSEDREIITCGISSRSGRTVPGGILQYRLNMRLVGAQSRSGSVGEGKGSNACRNSSHDSSSVQPLT